MQRRQLLKLLIPLSLATAGLASGWVFLKKSACDKLDLTALRDLLKPFADAALAKTLAAGAVAVEPFALDTGCEQGFETAYRQRLAADFAAGKIKNVDGWLLSETEAFTHLLVYQPASLSGVQPIAGSAP